MSQYWEIPRAARMRFGEQSVEPMAQRTSHALGAYRDEIEHASIPTVRSLVAIPERPWRFEQAQVVIYVFGTFSSIFRTIELMSVPLSRKYREEGVLPILRPIPYPGASRALEHAEQMRRRFSLSGILLLDKGNPDEG